jgi:HAD superfamily hydrolase (TIGR01490 family)
MMPLAIFDLDFTIIEGDSEWMWGEFLFEKGIVDKDFINQMSRHFHDYENGLLDMHTYQRFLLKPLTGLDAEVLKKLISEFLNRVQRLWRPEVLERINWHRHQGHMTLLISATSNILVEPIASMLNFPQWICTSIELDHNVPTGELNGIPAFREGKIQNLDIWLDKHAISMEDSWGYSDSHNDIPLLERVEHPVAVTPDNNLRKHALLKGWRVMDL